LSCVCVTCFSYFVSFSRRRLLESAALPHWWTSLFVCVCVCVCVCVYSSLSVCDLAFCRLCVCVCDLFLLFRELFTQAAAGVGRATTLVDVSVCLCVCVRPCLCVTLLFVVCVCMCDLFLLFRELFTQAAAGVGRATTLVDVYRQRQRGGRCLHCRRRKWRRRKRRVRGKWKQWG